MQHVVEAAVVSKVLLGDAHEQSSLLVVAITFLALNDGLGAVVPKHDGSRVVEDDLLDLLAYGFPDDAAL